MEHLVLPSRPYRFEELRERGNAPPLEDAAVVFAPHPDDETLGCGGTIIRKVQAGAPLRVVFMCDGALSHAHLMAGTELKTVRRNEALRACQELGLTAGQVTFLDYREGHLSDAEDEAAGRVYDLLKAQRPRQVYLPYYNDVHTDHVATNRIVRGAMHRQDRRYEVYEYPVWYWYHWPAVPLPVRFDRPTLRLIRGTILTAMGWHARRHFTCGTFVSEVLAEKHAALDEHATQMTEYIPGSGWSTLAKVADGQFLPYFFQKYELFRRYVA